jgi:hypothetical protein
MSVHSSLPSIQLQYVRTIFNARTVSTGLGSRIRSGDIVSIVGMAILFLIRFRLTILSWEIPISKFSALVIGLNCGFFKFRPDPESVVSSEFEELYLCVLTLKSNPTTVGLIGSKYCDISIFWNVQLIYVGITRKSLLLALCPF